ncbi:hypothetical protein PHYSODRAFT_496665 [Phytophthora sojae]|uniref:Uncharacterized protein n=1 Tax=Phytophthora sojae (strain P6497) TaxID=1094619 RepID=G4ZC10_PHYSP|nr:hypothetical protein PHYSODRAFT_488217 [Phytophthora sojae]XP_009524844.1 hypothetical protein PHYSODRAFT_496665 [Phytophthora sojae]EGZ22111.1 hypothetical protein PHYSODRAFT_488217 [Phytophthora sojae]EGZ22127.1 hypothetical protein PHYSODRAFT_496665 [Phytophthora sojae]|eukprot:XP_009524828.1 hypothetical protein PHYSODRAFT_488217 [Phytophthora sojae]
MSKKSVRWSTVTVYEFGVGIGGSAVPRRGGPAVGLAKTPRCVWSTSVDAAQSELATENAALEVQEGKAGSAPASTAARRHRRRVRWLKPLERVTMLEKAGYSEERIYRMLMESSSIAQSRRLCLRVASLECAAA